LYIQVFENTESLVSSTVLLLSDRFLNGKKAKIGLATGKTMIPLYEAWIKAWKGKKSLYQNIEWFMLDEFADVSLNHPDSYSQFLNEHFFEKLEIDSSQIYPMKNDPAEYEKLIQDKNWLDLQILGIGLNGHVGLNEPHGDPKIGTHYHALTPQTVEVHLKTARDKSFIPKKAMTQGISTLLHHRELWLLAWGASKKTIVKDLILSDETKDLPASLLKNHPGFKLLLDQDAYLAIQ
jgi:glucosamine-6-phosphate deaminase